MKKLISLILFSVIFTISHAQLISVSVSANQTKICEGDSVKLQLKLETIGTPELRVVWNPDYNITSDTLDSPVVFPKHSTTYTALVTDIENNVSVSASITISVVPKPVVIAPPVDSVCINEPYFLFPEHFDNSLEPSWKHNGKGFFMVKNDSLNVTYIPAENEMGTVRFILTGKGIDFCKDVSDTTYLYYTGTTSAIINNSEQLICSNTPIELSGEVENIKSFKWKHNGKGELIDANTLNPTYVPNEREFGNVQIILEAIGSICTRTDTFSFEVSPIYVEFTGEIEACEGDQLLLNILGSPNYNYLWNTGQTNNQILIEATHSKVYAATITNDDNCSTQAEIVLTVIERPVIDVRADLEDKMLIISPSGLTKYEIYDENDNLISTTQSNYFDYSTVPENVNKLIVVGYNQFGCASDKEGVLDGNAFLIPKLEKVNAFSPNDDGINDRLLPGRKTKVFDRTSKILYDGWEGWDGTYKGKEMPQGTYFYILYDGNNIFYKGPVTILR